MNDPYHELAAYTLGHDGPVFIHQYVVDAHMLQQCDEHTKPVGPFFALMGLYLHIEKGYTGREVQLAHMHMGKKKHVWPTFALPNDRGVITPEDVMKAAPGTERDTQIEEWMTSVWAASHESHEQIRQLAQEYGVDRKDRFLRR